MHSYSCQVALALPIINCLLHLPFFPPFLPSLPPFLSSTSLSFSPSFSLPPSTVHCSIKDWALHCREQGRQLDRRNEVTKEYALRVRVVAESLDLHLVDFHLAMSEQCAKERDGGSRFFTDGLHLSQEGNGVLADLLVPTLEGVWQGRGPVLPDWKAVDPLHPEARLLHQPSPTPTH